MQFIDLESQYRRLEESIDRRIKIVLNHGKFIIGPEVKELELRLAEYVGTQHCIGVSSGTDGLLLALMALDIGPGDEVIMPAFNYIAAIEMVRLLGASPILVDINAMSYNVEPKLVEKSFTDKTKAIIAVNLYGQCADYEALGQLAQSKNIPVIEDAAQSFGATFHGRKSCSLADIGVTSFFPSKPLGCYGDGGAVFTSNDDLAEKIQMISRHGQVKKYQHQLPGINARLDTIQAAILLSKLEVFDDEIKARQSVAEQYDILLNDSLNTISCPRISAGCTSVYAQYTIESECRDSLQNFLTEVSIPTAVHYPKTISQQAAFLNDSVCAPISERAANRVLSLPMHPYLDTDAQKRIANAIFQFSASNRTGESES